MYPDKDNGISNGASKDYEEDRIHQLLFFYSIMCKVQYTQTIMLDVYDQSQTLFFLYPAFVTRQIAATKICFQSTVKLIPPIIKFQK